MSNGGRFFNDLSDSDVESAVDVNELPNEYRIKLNTFLRSACNEGYEALTKSLIDKGADVNYVTNNTQLPTALHVAVSSTRESILPILLSSATNATVQAALQYAVQYQTRLSNVIRILQKDDALVKNPDDSKDRDEDKSPVDKVSKETETQTTAPAQKENETQTNDGMHNEPQHKGQQPSDPLPQKEHERSHSPALSSPAPPPPTAPASPSIPSSSPSSPPLSHNDMLQITQLQQQLQEQQQKLQEQQQSLREQQIHTEQTQRKAEQAQQVAQRAQTQTEDMANQMQKQDQLIESQERHVKELNEQLNEQKACSQKLQEQLNANEHLTHQLTEQLSTHESETQKLRGELRAQLDRMEELKLRIAQLEAENKDLNDKLASHESKSEEQIQDLQSQIIIFQTDIEAKTRRIETVSKERDSERKAKEIAKSILSSHGPADTPTLGQSYAIRMGSIASPSPTPLDDDEQPSTPPPNLFRSSSYGRARGGAVANGMSSSQGRSVPIGSSEGDLLSRRARDTPPPRISNPHKLSSKSRSKDDMDIASEADKARVRRLVDRWEEIKFIELRATK